ncbi:MAG: outer membrane beta-barrel protein [Proteobacteria bacterium]|nr:outer membrane beta-barrel protein [Pseudomonadota bacterium]
MTRVFFGALLVIAVLAAASSATAADAQGFYFGGGVGSTWLSVYDNNNNDCCYYYYDNNYNSETSDSFASFTAFAGYRFGSFVAAEVGYFYADNPEWNEYSTYIGELDDVFDSFVQLDYESVQISVLGILPFADIWEAYLRGGASFSKVQGDRNLVRVFDGALFEGTIDNDDTEFLFGIGVGVNLTPSLHVRLEFNTVPIDNNIINANGDASIDSVKIEAVFRPFAKP